MVDLNPTRSITCWRKCMQSGRQLIGFDLVEVGVGETSWDSNVGASVFIKLCNILAAANN